MQNTSLIRNFCIIAHVDHGKSTLADRLLQITHTVSERDMQEQYLDKIGLERERGITIKLQAVRMLYQKYILNLIDTPGHIDFAYEVNRALAACEGAILLIDASQGIEAQTLSNLYKAQTAGLVLIPVVNKIDLPTAHPEDIALDLQNTLGFSQDEIIFTSGKTGDGMDDLLAAIIERIPPPSGKNDQPLQALVFDSFYDAHKGVVSYVRVVNGTLNKEPLGLINTQTIIDPIEIGYIGANTYVSAEIQAGEVGYVATGLKDINKVRVGDTITTKENLLTVTPLSGYQEPKPMVFANIFPEDADQIRELREAVERYNLTDAAFTFEPINSSILGSGFRCGFLGLLHVDIVRERIAQEYGVETQITTPNVQYKVILKNGTHLNVQSAAEMPEPNEIESIEEPWCKVSLYSRNEYIGPLMQVSEDHRGEFVGMNYLGEKIINNRTDSETTGTTRVELTYQMPLAEVISNYFDEIKSVSSGYASLDYEIIKYQTVDLVKLEILLNKESHPALARLVVRKQSHDIATKLVNKLKENLPRQQFKVPIQAAIGGSVIARDDIAAMRKDVTAKLYGGDRTRKDKLLKKQAKGKKRMQAQGRITIPYKTYQEIIKL